MICASCGLNLVVSLSCFSPGLLCLQRGDYEPLASKESHTLLESSLMDSKRLLQTRTFLPLSLSRCLLAERRGISRFVPFLL